MKSRFIKTLSVFTLALILLIAGCSKGTADVAGEWGGTISFGPETYDILLTFRDNGSFTVYPEEEGHRGTWRFLDGKTMEFLVQDSELPVSQFSYKADSKSFKFNSKDSEIDIKFDLRKMNGQELLDIKQRLKAESLSRVAMNTAGTVAVNLAYYVSEGGNIDSAGMRDGYFVVGKNDIGEDIIVDIPHGIICEIEDNMVVAKTTDGTFLESVQWKE